MSLDSIRSSLRTKVAGVTGISGVAPVYDYLRYVTDEDGIRDLLVAGQGRVHYWSVTPAVGDTFSLRQRMGCQDGVYRWDVHGFYALKDADASEKVFLVIVEAVLNALRTDLTLGSTVRPVEGELPRWVEHDHRQIGPAGSVLCHHAKITLAVKKEL
jgi:hypothetical protein